MYRDWTIMELAPSNLGERERSFVSVCIHNGFFGPTAKKWNIYYNKAHRHEIELREGRKESLDRQ